jgi:hypothetical protein
MSGFIFLNLKLLAEANGFSVPLFVSPEQYLRDFNIYNPYCLSFENVTLDQLRKLVGHCIEKIPDLDKRNQVYKAFRRAQEIHSLQVRDNQDPYLIHALKVAVLADRLNETFEMGFATDIIMQVALLHDTREDHPEYWAWHEHTLRYPQALPAEIDQLIINKETVSRKTVEAFGLSPKLIDKYFSRVNTAKFILPSRMIEGALKYPELKDILEDRLVFNKNIPNIDEDPKLKGDKQKRMLLKLLRDEFLTDRQEIRDWGYQYLKREYPQSIRMKLYGRQSVAKMIYLLSKPHVLGMTSEERVAAIEKYYETELAKAPLMVILIKLADRFSNLYDLKHVENAPKRYHKLIEETKKYLVPMIEKNFFRKVNLWVKHMLEPNQMNRQAAIGAVKAKWPFTKV